MSVETPKIVRQVRKEAKELQPREERVRDLRRRVRYLIENEYTELRPLKGIKAKLGLVKPVPIVRKTFGEGKESVEVEISPHGPPWFSPMLNPNLDTATLRVIVGNRVFWIPPEKMPRYHPKLENETVGLLEELITAIEKLPYY